MKTLQTWKYHRKPRVTLSRAEEKRHLWHETAGCPCTFPVTSSVPQELTGLISNIIGWSVCSWVSWKWNHMACAVLCVCLLLLSIARETHPCGCVWQSFIHFPCRIQFHCMNIPHCDYPSYFWVVSDFVAVGIMMLWMYVWVHICMHLCKLISRSGVAFVHTIKWCFARVVPIYIPVSGHWEFCMCPLVDVYLAILPTVAAPLPFFSWSHLCCLSSCLALFSS